MTRRTSVTSGQLGQAIYVRTRTCGFLIMLLWCFIAHQISRFVLYTAECTFTKPTSLSWELD